MSSYAIHILFLEHSDVYICIKALLSEQTFTNDSTIMRVMSIYFVKLREICFEILGEIEKRDHK